MREKRKLSSFPSKEDKQVKGKKLNHKGGYQRTLDFSPGLQTKEK